MTLGFFRSIDKNYFALKIIEDDPATKRSTDLLARHVEYQPLIARSRIQKMSWHSFSKNLSWNSSFFKHTITSSLF